MSTDEKLGVEALLDEPPLEELPLLPDVEGEVADGEDEDGLLDEPLEEPPVAALPDVPAPLLPEVEGEVADGEDDDGLLDEELDCAEASVDSAKSTAAAVMLRPLGTKTSLHGG